MLLLYIIIFLGSCLLLAWASSWLVSLLAAIGRYLGWREFIVAFIVMAFASTLPNLFVGISSALRGIPQLSLSEIVGGNVVDLALTAALVVLLSKDALPASSRMVQSSTIFTAGVAVAPLLLMLDGQLGRGDGLTLLLIFVFYLAWLFSKDERFKKRYAANGEKGAPVERFASFGRNSFLIIFALACMLLASQGVVMSSVYFSQTLNLPLAIIGILIVGLANCLPEIYFSVVSARKGQNWLVLGDLMGAIIMPATLVLGIVCLISPIKIVDFNLFAIARIFLVVAAIVFLLAIRTGQKITRQEALILLAVYLSFVLAEIIAIRVG
ncbi:MAG: sodium:calcium antiporter [Patescibacteria group bacterium]